ncbi:Uncharacterized conserved protein [Sphingomonas guangdongensis]|uniref:Uncharacterized conserved protein n=1 Tax=Sphingomonas guangdongensis TaxID=1141890 RepID=A0A285QYX0_9SPHN|nr:DUF2285 domain-containing protein [Sphingomonas guangdongensis]SOB87155.1 Uncharacterized conserved protein [Sphingomonas guangdongensis]
MAPSMSNAFLDCPPDESAVTDYDRAHLKIYLRLLDADAAGACWQEIAPILFGVDPAAEPCRAESICGSHLERAKWMTTHGPDELRR